MFSTVINKLNSNVKRKTLISKKVNGFTLTELLIVLAIIGILILVALPDQSSTISKAKAVEAKLQLQALHSMQKAYFYEYSKYAENLSELGFEQMTLVSQGGQANYQIEINITQEGYEAVATSVVDFDRDGNFNTWKIDQNKSLQEIIKD